MTPARQDSEAVARLRPGFDNLSAQCVQDLGRPLQHDAEVLVSLIPGNLCFVYSQTTGELALREALGDSGSDE